MISPNAMAAFVFWGTATQSPGFIGSTKAQTWPAQFCTRFFRRVGIHDEPLSAFVVLRLAEVDLLQRTAPRIRLFESRNGSPLSAGNIRNRVLHPLLARLGIPKAGLHPFRHSRVTLLRKNGTPADLQKLWIGHSGLRTTDRYAHTDQELDYRHREASRVGLDLIVGPNVASWTQSAAEGEEPAKTTA